MSELERAASLFVNACAAVDDEGAEVERAKARLSDAEGRREAARSGLVSLVNRLAVDSLDRATSAIEGRLASKGG